MTVVIKRSVHGVTVSHPRPNCMYLFESLQRREGPVVPCNEPRDKKVRWLWIYASFYSIFVRFTKAAKHGYSWISRASRPWNADIFIFPHVEKRLFQHFKAMGCFAAYMDYLISAIIVLFFIFIHRQTRYDHQN